MNFKKRMVTLPKYGIEDRQVIMPYRMRFVFTGSADKTLTMGELAAGLCSGDRKYSIEDVDSDDDGQYGSLLYDDVEYASIEISWSGNIYHGDLAWMRQKASAADGNARDTVISALSRASGMFVLEVLQDPEISDEARWPVFDSVFDWLFEHWQGLLYADLEGFYDDDHLILACN